MPTWICDAPIGSAVFVAFAAAVGDDGSDAVAAVAEVDVLFAAAEALAAAPDVCTELAVAVVVAAAVDAVVVVDCNTADRTAAAVDAVAAADAHNALDTVAAAVAVDGGCTDDGADIVAVDDTVAADGRTAAVDGVNCRTCCHCGGRRPG